MRLRTSFLAALLILLAGCVERYSYQHVNEDAVTADTGEVEGGDVSGDAADVGGDGACAPDCAGRICGPDGCGGACGDCGVGYTCDPKGETCAGDCEALCDGLQCGTAGLDDECGCGDCDDDEACTDDFCGDGTCVYDPLDKECDDGDPCTIGDWCVEGLCAATDKNCDDGNPCTGDACGEAGECVYTNNTVPCNDEDPCTVPDVCADGACVGQPKGCADDNPCTKDSCSDAGVCDHDPVAMNGEPCDDGNPCTDDACSGGGCVGTLKLLEDLEALDCLCAEDADCTDLEDADVCNGTLVCEKDMPGDPEGICVVDDGTILTCADEIGCTVDSCDPVDGCTFTGADDLCADEDPCTDDLCDVVLGCQHPFNAAPCDDGDQCTDGDLCAEGVCAGPDVTDCDDQIACTADGCQAESGCSHVPDDGLCPDSGECQVGVCLLTAGCSLADADAGTLCVGGSCKDGACVLVGQDLSCAEINACVKACGIGGSGCMQVCVDAGTVEGKDLFADFAACMDIACPAPVEPSCPPVAEAGACAAEAAACESGCAPDCAGKDCGDDGCGGSCGDCGGNAARCHEGACMPADMVWVSPGVFGMGCVAADTECEGDEDPFHEVTLDGFGLDETEVTVLDYTGCVDDGGACGTPGTGDNCLWATGWGVNNNPINCVTWDMAEAYCAWTGKRLCTEAEWEKGARGTDGRIYPWGAAAPTCALAVIDGCVGGTQEVGIHPGGASPYGAQDMLGNVWEWTADWYAGDYYCNGDGATCTELCSDCADQPAFDDPWVDPEGPAAGSLRVTRGAAFSHTDVPGGLGLNTRNSRRLGRTPTDNFPTVGFRCCWSP
ncbi:MAG: SUMF1/EgtB/PvdO family nonheme iron enzyme [Pseudomonadota bacterium]